MNSNEEEGNANIKLMMTMTMMRIMRMMMRCMSHCCELHHARQDHHTANSMKRPRKQNINTSSPSPLLPNYRKPKSKTIWSSKMAMSSMRMKPVSRPRFWRRK